MITTRAVPALLPHHHRRVAQNPAPSEMSLPTPWVYPLGYELHQGWSSHRMAPLQMACSNSQSKERLTHDQIMGRCVLGHIRRFLLEPRNIRCELDHRA
jgi:hypothetical protein